MRPCFQVDIITPKRILLRGLWFGPQKPKRCIVFIHGMMSSAFSMLSVVDALIDRNTSVLAFNNRGVETIADLEKVPRDPTSTNRWLSAGTAHEVFTECVDDLQGAINFVRESGSNEVYLLGHSTGCQKAAYWAHKKRRGVSGLIFLAPISDYAAETKRQGRIAIKRATRVARALVARGKGKQLLPPGTWYEILDANRFLSLYIADGVEEIFPYSQPKAIPDVLQAIRIPILVLIAEKDEYRDRPAKQMALWFDQAIVGSHTVAIVPSVRHDFRGGESQVADFVKIFFSSNDHVV
jgi:alpha-beta hydrolase superfamily lysophospholipase